MNADKSLAIGIMGARGSFSEEAANFYIRKHAFDTATLAYLIGAEQVLQALDNGEVDKGIFPIENSNGGFVYEALYAMANHTFHIEEIFEIDVRHNLLVRHGVTTDHITTVTSHDQALKQCRMYLKRVWGNVELKEYEDTAKAAKDLGEGKLPDTTAVIAPRVCAEMYDLDILEESVQDLKFNFTTFIAVTKR